MRELALFGEREGEDLATLFRAELTVAACGTKYCLPFSVYVIGVQVRIRVPGPQTVSGRSEILSL